MYLRFTMTAFAMFLLPLPASGVDALKKQENLLAPAALQMKLKNYSSAAMLASDLPESGQRDLVVGIAEFKRGRNAEAAVLLGRAVKNYPLLADYALYYQAEATRRTGRFSEAVQLLKTLQKGYPDSPHLRKSLFMEGEILFESGEYASAGMALQKFIEKYPSGSDALQASYRLAGCKDKTGDGAGAAALLRLLWINSPGSVQAGLAEEDMKRLAAAGVAIRPYSSQELFKRASGLYEQRRYDQAVTAFRAIVTRDEKRDFIDRVRLKTGQALLKARRYQDAESSFKELSLSASKVETRSEAAYLLARAVEKSGRDEEAFVAYTGVATAFPESAEADNALLDAAFIRKFQNRPKETAELLDKILVTYPKTGLRQRIIWESGWANYLAGNMTVAADQFKKLFSSEEYRERALFWHGKSLAAGDKAAESSFSQLRKEFPLGFYALSIKSSVAEEPGERIPLISGDPAGTLPLPDGYERVKALISLGLIDDAATELAAGKKRLAKGKGEAALARLYLELGNYNGAMGLYNSSTLKRFPESSLAWSFLYPKAFNELVIKYSEKAGVDPSLAYAVMKAESAFAPLATSPVGARGLMQLMPQTAAMVLHEKKIEPERLYDPELNIRLGTKHLKELIDKYNGNQTAVIASYNAGAHNVNRWLKTYANLKGEEFIESIPFAETRDYVKKVLAVAAIYRRLYGMK
jgi:soluble lytic murein transglycosylase